MGCGLWAVGCGLWAVGSGGWWARAVGSGRWDLGDSGRLRGVGAGPRRTAGPGTPQGPGSRRWPGPTRRGREEFFFRWRCGGRRRRVPGGVAAEMVRMSRPFPTLTIAGDSGGWNPNHGRVSAVWENPEKTINPNPTPVGGSGTRRFQAMPASWWFTHQLVAHGLGIFGFYG